MRLPKLVHALLRIGVLLAVLALSLELTLRSDRVERQLKDRVTAALSRALGSPVEVEAIEIEPLRLRARVLDLTARIGPLGPEVEAEELRVGLSVPRLLAGRTRWSRARVLGARLRIGPETELTRLKLGSVPPNWLPRRLALERVTLDIRRDGLRLLASDLGGLVQVSSGGEIRPSVTLDLEELVWRGHALPVGRLATQLAVPPGGADIEVSTLTLDGASVDLRASGAIARQPWSAELDLESTLDLAPLLAARGLGGLAEGSAAIDGSLRGPLAAPRFAGRLLAERLLVRGRVPLSGLSADLLVGQAGVRVGSGEASVLGGQLRFRAQAALRGSAVEVPFFECNGLDLGEAARVFPGLPLTAGEADLLGEARLPFQGPVQASASVEVRKVEPRLPARFSDERLDALRAPLQGTLALSLDAPQVTVTGASLQSETMALTAQGTIVPGGAIDLSLSAPALDISPMARLLPVKLPWRSDPALYRLSGVAAAQATVSGTTPSPRLEGRLEASAALLGGPGEEWVHIGRLQAEVAIADGTLTYRASSRGVLSLDCAGDVAGESRRLRTTAELDAGLLTRLLGLPAWLRGPVEVDLTRKEDGNGAITAEVALGFSGEALGQALERVDARLGLHDRRLQLASLTARAGSGSLQASGSLAVDGGGLEATIDARGLPLSSLARAAGLAGRADLKAKLSGTTADPILDAEVSTEDLAVGGVPLGAVTGTGRVQGGRLEAKLVRDEAIDASLELSLRPPRSFVLTAAVDDLDVSAALPASGLLKDVIVSGDLRLLAVDGSVAEAALDLRGARASLGDIQVVTDPASKARLRYAGGKIAVEGLAVRGPETSLAIAGVIGLASGTDLEVSGKTDLGAFAALLPGTVLSGPVTLDARLTGTLQAPALTGELKLERGYFRGAGLPFPLRDAVGEVKLRGRTAVLDQLSGRFGGGRIEASGELELKPGAEPSLRLAVTGTGVRLVLFGGLDVRADPDLTYTLAGSRRSLRGTLQVTRARYRARDANPELALATGPGFLHGLRDTDLKVTVEAPGNLWFESPDAELEGEARLYIGGTSSDPVVLGTITYIGQTRLRLQGRPYTVNRGQLIFDNPFSIDPRLDFQAETRLPSYDVLVEVTGSLSDPRVQARSDPPLPMSDIFAVLLGSDPESAGAAGAAGSREADLIRPLLYSRALGETIGRLSRGVIRYDPLALSGRASPSELLPVGIQVSSSFDATVGIPLDDARSPLVIFNWRPKQSYALSLTSDINQAYGGDLSISRRFGGPLAVSDEPYIRVLSVDGIAAVGMVTPFDLQSKVGERLERQELRDDGERLTELLREAGHPLARVESSVLPAAGGVAVRYQVDPGVPVELALEGTDDPEDAERLEEPLLDTIQAFGLYEDSFGEMERVARDALEREGYAKSLVSCDRPLGPAEARQQIRCEIDTGQRFKVEELDLVGGADPGPPDLRRRLRIKTGLFRTTRLVSSDVAVDLATIRTLYQRLGYLDAKATAEVKEGSRPDAFVLAYHIEPGQRYTIEAVTVSGESAVSRTELLEALGEEIEAGDPLEQKRLRRARDALSRIYDRRGYWGTTLKTDVAEDRQAGRAKVAFAIREGTLTRVRGIKIEGLDRTRERIARREMRLKPGDLLSYDRIATLQRRLYDLGVFRSVEVNAVESAFEPESANPVEPAVPEGSAGTFAPAGPEGSAGADPDRAETRDVLVRVVEAKPYRLQLGGGYDTQEGPRGLFEISDRNFRGSARYLGLQALGSARNGLAQLVTRDPRPFGLPWPALVAASYRAREEVSYDLREAALHAEASRFFDDAHINRLVLRYALTDTDLDDLTISPLEAGAESIRLSGFGVTLIHDRRDDVLEPRKGMLASADAEWASDMFGSQANLFKVALKGYAYVPLARRLVFASAAQAGIGISFDTDERLPLTERYFTGGASTLRGFGYNEAGPKDPETGEPTGGNAVLVFNQELRYEVLPRFVASTFLDVGNVYREVNELGRDLRLSAGVGLRARGPLVAGVDIGWLLDPRAGEDPYRVHFSLGYAF